MSRLASALCALRSTQYFNSKVTHFFTTQVPSCCIKKTSTAAAIDFGTSVSLSISCESISIALKIDQESCCLRNTSRIPLCHEMREYWFKYGATTADSPFSQLLQEDYFSQVQLDLEAETLVWPNGLDFCPDTLYTWALEAEIAPVSR